ncbi:MAG: hypothetical protein K6G90_14545 [Clostridia bacterium]|nr:hypothetical protein [Clostridia bacterium]
MAIISVETVAFTKSALKKGFNGDNINIKGHAIPQAKADSGYQAKGTMDIPCRALVASSENKCAYDAAEAFRDYFHNIDNARGDAQAAVEEYISDMDTVMSKMANAELSLGLVCVYDNRVIIGKSRDCHVMRFTGGELFETALTGRGGTGYQMITNAEDGDVFILLGAQASSIVDYDAVARILDENESLPSMIKPLYESFSAADKTADCTIVLMKIKTDGKAAAPSGEPLRIFAAGAAAPAGAAGDFGFAPAISSDEVDGMRRPVLDDYGEPVPEVRKPSLGKRILTVLPIALVVILVGGAIGLYMATKDTRDQNKKDKTTAAPAAVSETEPVAVPVTEPESISFTDLHDIEELSNNQTTTKKAENATRAAAAATTARRAASTTRSSSSSSTPTTAARTVTTTKAPETTAAYEETPFGDEDIGGIIDLDNGNGGEDEPTTQSGGNDTPTEAPNENPNNEPEGPNDNPLTPVGDE